MIVATHDKFLWCRTYLPTVLIIVVLRILPINLFHAAYPLDVPTWIKTLTEQFDCLHEYLVNELSRGGILVDQVLQVLTRLPLTFRMEYESTIQNMLPELVKEKVVHNLFYHLNPLFTFIDYELLQHLISKFGSQELKQEMILYTEKVQLFKKVTTIGELVDCWPSLKVPQIDYKMLRAKFAGDPKSYTLEKLDFFRNRFYPKVRRSEFVTVSILMLLESANSFIEVCSRSKNGWKFPYTIIQEWMIISSFMKLSNFGWFVSTNTIIIHCWMDVSCHQFLDKFVWRK